MFLGEAPERGAWGRIPRYLDGMVFSQNSLYQGMVTFQIEASGVVVLAVSKGWGGGGGGILAGSPYYKGSILGAWLATDWYH